MGNGPVGATELTTTFSRRGMTSPGMGGLSNHYAPDFECDLARTPDFEPEGDPTLRPLPVNPKTELVRTSGTVDEAASNEVLGARGASSVG